MNPFSFPQVPSAISSAHTTFLFVSPEAQGPRAASSRKHKGSTEHCMGSSQRPCPVLHLLFFPNCFFFFFVASLPF